MLPTAIPVGWRANTNDWYLKSTLTTNNNVAILFYTGHTFCGMTVNGKRQGYGTYYWNDGSRYEGEFHDDMPCGEGTYYSSDGLSQKVTN